MWNVNRQNSHVINSLLFPHCSWSLLRNFKFLKILEVNVCKRASFMSLYIMLVTDTATNYWWWHWWCWWGTMIASPHCYYFNTIIWFVWWIFRNFCAFDIIYKKCFHKKKLQLTIPLTLNSWKINTIHQAMQNWKSTKTEQKI